MDADQGQHLVVTVTNSGTNTTTAQLEAGLYDQAGNVVAASIVRPLLTLPPGTSSPAAFNKFNSDNGNVDLLSTVVSYTVQIDPSASSTFANTT